jgi:isopentenyl phosphate kinase
MRKLILIKFGGSLITDKTKPYTSKPGTISRLAKEIKKAEASGYKILISHGSGSFGHTLASKYKTADGIKKKEDVLGLCLVQQDAIAINRIVNKIFLENKINCLSFFPSSFSLARNKNLESIFVGPIITALKHDIIPIVFGDIILDAKLGCCIFSGEVTLNNLSSELIKRGFKIEKIIYCGITDGVYDAEGKTISVLNPKKFRELKQEIGASDGIDVTGGMAHKVDEAIKMAKRGIETLIINGRIVGNLEKAILGQETKGTLIKNRL